jgi:hypothetical protein
LITSLINDLAELTLLPIYKSIQKNKSISKKVSILTYRLDYFKNGKFYCISKLDKFTKS